MQLGKQIIKKSAKQTRNKVTKKERLLTNPDIKRWYENISRGSSVTAEVRLRRLSHFCEMHNITPMQVIELSIKDLRTATDLIQDHITWMEERNHSPGYIRSSVTSIKSWLSHFDIQIRRKVKVANADSTPTLEDERVPNNEEFAEIFDRASLREAVSISLMAKAGLRPGVLGNHNGTDGLTMKDLPDIIIQQGLARCIQSPARIIIRKTLSKARHQYLTFLTSEGVKKLLAYLNDRIVKGDALNAESPIIAPDATYKTFRGGNTSKKFLPTRRICYEIRRTFRPRFLWRPYVLRAYFDTQLLIAESRGKIAHDFRVFFMGHKGTIEAKYTTNKGILSIALINEMKEAFNRSEEFLDLEIKKEDPLIQRKEQLQHAIEGATPEQLGKMQEMFQLLGICNINQAKG